MSLRTSGGVHNRRLTVIKSLELQLVRGLKKQGILTIPLEDADIKRIKKEILTLKTRV